MAKTRVVDLVDRIFTDFRDEIDEDIELVDSEFVKEGSNRILRVLIDKETGIGFDDCKQVTKVLETRLDEIDPIKEKYILEVSSCGIERPLKKMADFERFEGRLAELKLYAPINNVKVIVGVLSGVKSDMILIEDENTGNIVELSLDKIASAKLKFRF